MTIPGSVGLFIGAWGMASAVARLVGNVLGGVIRDGITVILNNAVAGYAVVFTLEMALLLVSLWLLRKVDVKLFKKEAAIRPSILERAALVGD
jgi:BCD family chlorophyll transporter-like MFS transporter